MSKLWKKWLSIAHFIGNVQMVVLLTLVYWVALAPMAIVLKIVSDPLALRKRENGGWVRRPPPANGVDAMKKQY